MPDFYSKFQQLCAAKNLFPSTACKEMGLSPSAINRWKEGSTPNRSTLFRMAEYFGYEPESFLNYVYDPNGELDAIVKVSKKTNNALTDAAKTRPNTVTQNPINSLLDILNDPVLIAYTRILDRCTPEQKRFLQSVIEELTNAQRNRT